MANGARSSRGLPGYGVRGDLAAAAQRQADRMAASRSLYHTPGLGSAVCCWASLGENVGVGADAGQIHNAFMNSSGHRSNILSTDFTEIGVGSTRGADGRLYVSEIFRRPSGAVAVAPRTVTRVSRSAPRAPIVRRTVTQPRRVASRPVVRPVRPPVSPWLSLRRTLATPRTASGGVAQALRMLRVVSSLPG
jgi:hypothetical protein